MKYTGNSVDDVLVIPPNDSDINHIVDLITEYQDLGINCRVRLIDNTYEPPEEWSGLSHGKRSYYPYWLRSKQLD